MFSIDKFSLIITTRCNLKCRLCCEFVPQNKPFSDMTAAAADKILSAAFDVFDRITTVHLTGGGEPFLHKNLAELIETTMKYSDKFDRLMLFTNSTVSIPENVLSCLKKYRDKIIVQVSHYGVNPKREKEILNILIANNVNCKTVKYYGEEQDFGGWVDFGEWKQHGRKPEELEQIFANCAITRDMHGNWRTRDGKLHWCTRSQRGNELGLIPDFKEDYLDLFDNLLTREQKQKKITVIYNTKKLYACDYCSGDHGTNDETKRFPAAEQIR